MNSSAYISSRPDAFSLVGSLIAATVSPLEGDPRLMYSGESWMCRWSDGLDLCNTSTKCSAHIALCQTSAYVLVYLL